jgi:hypothetical protein
LLEPLAALDGFLQELHLRIRQHRQMTEDGRSVGILRSKVTCRAEHEQHTDRGFRGAERNRDRRLAGIFERPEHARMPSFRPCRYQYGLAGGEYMLRVRARESACGPDRRTTAYGHRSNRQ